MEKIYFLTFNAFLLEFYHKKYLSCIENVNSENMYRVQSWYSDVTLAGD